MPDDKSLFSRFMADYDRFISMKRLEQIAKELAPEIDINHYAHATPEEIAAKFHVACLSTTHLPNMHFRKGGFTAHDCYPWKYRDGQPLPKPLVHPDGTVEVVLTKEELRKIHDAIDQSGIAAEIRKQDNNPKTHTTMTKEELIKYVGSLEKSLSVLRALANGKTIQYLSKSGWIDIDPNQLDIAEIAVTVADIRIKPDSTYRPYTEKEFAAALKNHTNFLRKKGGVTNNGIDWYDGTAVGFTTTLPFETYDKLLENFVWSDDNTPCGVPTDENQ